MNEHNYYLERSFALAQQAILSGNLPFSSLIVLDDKIVGETTNEISTEGELGHSEFLLLQQISKKYDRKDRQRMILYSIAEPCPMCLSACLLVGVKKIVYGVSASNILADLAPYINIDIKRLNNLAVEPIEIEGPFFGQKGIDFYKKYSQRTQDGKSN